MLLHIVLISLFIHFRFNIIIVMIRNDEKVKISYSKSFFDSSVISDVFPLSIDSIYLLQLIYISMHFFINLILLFVIYHPFDILWVHFQEQYNFHIVQWCIELVRESFYLFVAPTTSYYSHLCQTDDLKYRKSLGNYSMYS